MKIVFIGSGNVATHLAVALKESNNKILQVFSRTPGNAGLLAARVDAEPVIEIEHVYTHADLYIFSVKDEVLPEMVRQMPYTDGIWAHTAGSLPMDLLSAHKANYGVIYPLQTFSKTREVNFSDTPLFIEGDTHETTIFLEELAETISGNVHFLDSGKRRYLHLSAVFANNFANHMFTLASQILHEENIPFDVLKPLVLETAAKVMEINPGKAQTGPAIRHDEAVMQKHLEMIKDPQVKEIYTLLSKSIQTHSL